MATNIQTTTNGSQTPPPAAGVGHNAKAAREAALAAWHDACRSFGAQSGAGATSQLGWMQDMAQRAYRDELSPEDAVEGVKIYTEERRKKAAMLGKRVDGGEKALAVRISEAKKIIKLGGLPQFREKNNGGLGVFNAAIKVIGDDPNLKGETVKLVLKVATEQLRRPDEPMDADHIKQTLRPKESADKGEGEYLNTALKNVELAVKASSWDAHKRSIATSIKARIEQIGFKTAAQRRVEAMALARIAKEKKEAAAKAAAAKAAAKASKAK